MVPQYFPSNQIAMNLTNNINFLKIQHSFGAKPVVYLFWGRSGFDGKFDVPVACRGRHWPRKKMAK